MSNDATFPETAAFVRKMQQEGLGPRVCQSFASLYDRYRRGERGKIPWAEVEQPRRGDIVPFEQLAAPELRERGERLLSQLAVIRLNGGLGTSMKLEGPKSLIRVRGDKTFLDLTAEQVLALRSRYGVAVPGLYMHSFRTRDESLAALARHDLAARGLPLDFMQNKVPRIRKADALPAQFDDPEDDWAPPGHGDVYLALWSTGLLEQLRAEGIRWAFVSNADNLGATVDPALLGYLDRESVEFAMEVTDKSLADVKGGTLIVHQGRLTLLEVAQVEPEHVKDFQDISVFQVFNTNNLWWRLDALLERLERGALELQMIVNPKTVRGVEVVQLETAMGAAVGCFERALGIRVPRSRFAPVKTTADLLAVRSDAYVLDESLGIRPSPERDPAWGPPVISLDDRHYKGIEEFEARFPHPLSLVRCRKLKVEGDVRFGRDIRIEGEVTIRAKSSGPSQVPDRLIFGGGTVEL